MRRNRIEQKYNIDIHTTWVWGWHTCHKCREEVRFEHMWKFKVSPIVKASSYKYLCTTCAETKDDAIEYINDVNIKLQHIHKKQKTLNPPPLPPRKVSYSGSNSTDMC